jgi:hypothetical protein
VVVDQRAAEAELADGAAEFLGRCNRVLHRQRGEPAEPVRMLGHDPRQVVVGEPGLVPGGRRVDVGLQPGDGQRQHLDVDARRVHLRQPVLGEVGKLAGPVLDQAPDPPGVGPGKGWPVKVRDREGLLQGDVLHLVSPYR